MHDIYLRSQVAVRIAAIRQRNEESTVHGQTSNDESEDMDIFIRLALADESETEKVKINDQGVIRPIFLIPHSAPRR